MKSNIPSFVYQDFFLPIFVQIPISSIDTFKKNQKYFLVHLMLPLVTPQKNKIEKRNYKKKMIWKPLQVTKTAKI